jgi:type IV secretory pathway VirB3-like protein
MEYVELRIFCRNNNILCRVVLKNILYFAKRILSKRSRKFFSIIIKSPGLNHPGISAVSH